MDRRSRSQKANSASLSIALIVLRTWNLRVKASVDEAGHVEWPSGKQSQWCPPDRSEGVCRCKVVSECTLPPQAAPARRLIPSTGS